MDMNLSKLQEIVENRGAWLLRLFAKNSAPQTKCGENAISLLTVNFFDKDIFDPKKL